MADKSETEKVIGFAEWNEGDGVVRLDVVHTARTRPDGSLANSVRVRSAVSHYGGGIRVELPSMDRNILRWLVKALTEADSNLGPQDTWTYNRPLLVVGDPPPPRTYGTEQSQSGSGVPTS